MPGNITRRSQVCRFQRGRPSWIYEEKVNRKSTCARATILRWLFYVCTHLLYATSRKIQQVCAHIKTAIVKLLRTHKLIFCWPLFINSLHQISTLYHEWFLYTAILICLQYCLLFMVNIFNVSQQFLMLRCWNFVHMSSDSIEIQLQCNIRYCNHVNNK